MSFCFSVFLSLTISLVLTSASNVLLEPSNKFHKENKRLRKDVTCELDPPCIYESQEDLCVFLFPGTLGKSCSEQTVFEELYNC